MAGFYAYRYFLIDPIQKSLFKQVEKKEVSGNVINRLKVNKFWASDKKCVLYFIKELYKDTYLLKLGKQVKNKKYSPESKDICEVEIDDNYPYISIIFNCNFEQQIILIDKNTSAFKGNNISINKLKEMIEPLIKEQGYLIKIEPITYNNNFWNCITEADGISELKLTLNSPNLFGASFRANEFLKFIKSKYNNSSLEVKLKNEEDELTVDREDMGDIIDYIGQGGGKWSVKRTVDGKLSPVKSTNEENIKFIEVDLENEKSSSIENKVISIDDYYAKKLKDRRENNNEQ